MLPLPTFFNPSRSSRQKIARVGVRGAFSPRRWKVVPGKTEITRVSHKSSSSSSRFWDTRTRKKTFFRRRSTETLLLGSSRCASLSHHAKLVPPHAHVNYLGTTTIGVNRKLHQQGSPKKTRVPYVPADDRQCECRRRNSSRHS